MSQFTEDHAVDVAQRFAESDRAKMWHLFGRDVRQALLDAAIMDEMRVAASLSGKSPFTAIQVVQLRARVADLLANGIRLKTGRNPITVRYSVYD